MGKLMAAYLDLEPSRVKLTNLNPLNHGYKRANQNTQALAPAMLTKFEPEKRNC